MIKPIFYKDTSLPSNPDSSHDGVYFIKSNPLEGFVVYIISNGLVTQLDAVTTSSLTNILSEYSKQTLSASTSILIESDQIRRAALTGDVTASKNSNVTTIANEAVTFPKMRKVPTKTLLGNPTSSTANITTITVGSRLSLSSSGVLSADDMTTPVGTLDQLNQGTDTTSRSFTPKILNEWLSSKNYLTSYTDTTYSEITTSEVTGGTSSTLRTITGRRLKLAVDTHGLKIGTTSTTAKAGNWMPNWTDVVDRPTNLNQFTNGPGYVTTDTTYSEISTSEIDAGTSSTRRTITGRRIKYALDKKENTFSKGNILGTTGEIDVSNGTGRLYGRNSTTFSLSSTVKSDIAKGVTAHGWGNHASAGYIPYTGANQPINFNTQDFTTGGYTNRLHSYFERIHLASNSTSAYSNFKLLTNVAAAEIGNASSQTFDIIITLPITTTTHWQAEIDILRQGYRTTLNVGGYHTNNSSRFVNGVYGDISDIIEVKFGRIGDSTVLIIKRSNSSNHRLQVNISKFYYHHTNSVDLYDDKTKYKVEYIDESELIDFTLNGVVVNSQFRRDSYYLDYNNFTNTPTIPTVNNGQLSLSTGTGLSGSATFTANQSGSSSFSVAVASTHKLPTTAEWNALSTQTLSDTTSNKIVSNGVQRAALTGDVTASANSNATTIANNAVTHAKYQNIATQRILGRGTIGTGNVEELTLGSNLSLSTTGVLSATNTTYSAGTLALLNAGTNTTNRVWGAKVISDYVNSRIQNNDIQDLQWVTDVGNYTTNSIIVGIPKINNNPTGAIGLFPTDNYVGTPYIRAFDKGLRLVDWVNTSLHNGGTSDVLINQERTRFGMIGASSLTLPYGGYSFEFGYRALVGEVKHPIFIEFSTEVHNYERIPNAYLSNGVYSQLFHLPPENNATLATREWVTARNYLVSTLFTDKKVQQDSVASTAYRPIILGYSSNASKTANFSNSTDQTYFSNSLRVQPSTGNLVSKGSIEAVGGFIGNLAGNATTANGFIGQASFSDEEFYVVTNSISGEFYSGLDITYNPLLKRLTVPNIDGNASTATKLATARTIRTNLGSTTAVSFDGSGNITPGVTGTLPIARGGTGTTSAGTAAQLTVGTTTTARVWSPKILADYVKEYVYEDKRVVNAIGSYGANNDHGATIILSTSTNGIGFGSANALRDTFEVSLYNNSNGSKDIWGGDGFTYQLQDGTTSSTIKIKARGIGTITRITKGSTAIMLALGDFEI